MRQGQIKLTGRREAEVLFAAREHCRGVLQGKINIYRNESKGREAG